VDAVRGAIVAFEVEEYDAAAMTGWSVTVVGPSRVCETADSAPISIAIQVGLLRGWRVREAG
jgi:hypothetical protein